jgi:hypothetical protein
VAASVLANIFTWMLFPFLMHIHTHTHTVIINYLYTFTKENQRRRCRHRQFWRECGLNPPTRPPIYVLYKQFTHSGCLCKARIQGASLFLKQLWTVWHVCARQAKVDDMCQLVTHHFSANRKPGSICNWSVTNLKFCNNLNQTIIKISTKDDFLSNTFSAMKTHFI